MIVADLLKVIRCNPANQVLDLIEDGNGVCRFH